MSVIICIYIIISDYTVSIPCIGSRGDGDSPNIANIVDANIVDPNINNPGHIVLSTIVGCNLIHLSNILCWIGVRFSVRDISTYYK